MPLVVYILGSTIFSLTTSEFMVAGMMHSLNHKLIGGPLLTTFLLKLRDPNKQGLALSADGKCDCQGHRHIISFAGDCILELYATIM
ncbi:hypothetical protein N182_37795 [Sinorhizobium sp. GL2]|nr:hypothetical protein N182_37795 [Sinorhizobium sp. GL2]